MTTDLEIGRYLAHIRDKAGLKQNELAEKRGMERTGPIPCGIG